MKNSKGSSEKISTDWTYYRRSNNEVSFYVAWLLNIDKECRLKDAHDIEPLDRMQVHDWLVNQSNSNPWIEKGFKSAKSFRPEQKMAKNYDWIPPDSPYWKCFFLQNKLKISLEDNALYLYRLDIICIDALASSIYKT